MQLSVFEIVMLVCFGAAWPISIHKSWHSRTSAGKSVGFLAIVFLGYVAGVVHKLLYHLDPVIWLYALNGGMVFTDLLLWFRNRRFDRRRSAAVERQRTGE